MSENNIEIIEIKKETRGRKKKPEGETINIKEYMKEYNKKYYAEHKPEPKPREPKPRTNNLPKVIQCDICTCIVTTYTIKSHQKSKKCIVYGCLNKHGLMKDGQIL
jgi:hypothetical protein